jgi:hypothetical protein
MILLQSCQYLQQLHIKRAVALLLPRCRGISCSPAKQAAQLQAAAVKRTELQSTLTASCSWISTHAGRLAFPWQLQHHHHGLWDVASAVNSSSTRSPNPLDGSHSSSSSSSSSSSIGSGWSASSGSARGWVEAWTQVASATGKGAMTATAAVLPVFIGGSFSGAGGWGSGGVCSIVGRGSGRSANNRTFATSFRSSGKVRRSAFFLWLPGGAESYWLATHDLAERQGEALCICTKLLTLSFAHTRVQPWVGNPTLCRL